MPDLIARPMFGGIGLYSGDIFFGIVAADVLYFRVDDSTRQHYARFGSLAFEPFPDRRGSHRYFAVPTSILEHGPDLVEWARRAVRAARSDGGPGARIEE